MIHPKLNKKAIIVTILPFLLFSCHNYLILVDDSAKPEKEFQRDSVKVADAYQVILEFERKIISDSLANKSKIAGLEMKEVLNDLKVMLEHPNSTILGNTGHYCGVAAILNWLLNNQPEKYCQAVIELSFTGKARMGNSSSPIKLPGIIQKKVDYSVTGKTKHHLIRKNIDSTSIADFILGVSLLRAEKGLQRIGLLHPKASFSKKSIGNFVFANTMPWEMDDLFRKAGVEISQKAYYLCDREDIDLLLIIQKAVEDGKMPLVFDNHMISFTRTKNLLYRITGAHFITIHSFKVDTLQNEVHFTYWDYGRVKNNPWLTRIIRPFRTGNLKKDIRRNKKFKSRGLDKTEQKISTRMFLKAMKGYWIPD